MKRYLRQIVCLVICVCIAATSLSVMALTQKEKDQLNSDIANLKQQASVIQSEINKLKAEKVPPPQTLPPVRKEWGYNNIR